VGRKAGWGGAVWSRAGSKGFLTGIKSTICHPVEKRDPDIILQNPYIYPALSCIMLWKVLDLLTFLLLIG